MDFFPARKSNQPDDADATLDIQLSELQERLAECQRDASQSRVEFQARLQELEEQLAIRQKLNDRQRGDIESLQEQIEHQQLDLANQRRQHEEQLVKVKAELQDAKDVAQKRVEAAQRFKAELSLCRTSVGELQQELTGLKQQYSGAQASWQEQRELLQAQLQGYEETEAESIQRWQAEREERDLALQQSDRQLQEALERSQFLQERLLSSDSQLSDLQAELNSTRQERDEFKDRAHQLTDCVSELEARASADRVAAGALEHLETIEEEKEQLEVQLSAAQERLQKLEAEVGSWKEKYATQQMHNMRLKKALERSAEEELSTVGSSSKVPLKETAIKEVMAVPANSRSGADLPGFVK